MALQGGTRAHLPPHHDGPVRHQNRTPPTLPHPASQAVFKVRCARRRHMLPSGGQLKRLRIVGPGRAPQPHAAHARPKAGAEAASGGGGRGGRAAWNRCGRSACRHTWKAARHGAARASFFTRTAYAGRQARTGASPVMAREALNQGLGPGAVGVARLPVGGRGGGGDGWPVAGIHRVCLHLEAPASIHVWFSIMYVLCTLWLPRASGWKVSPAALGCNSGVVGRLAGRAQLRAASQPACRACATEGSKPTQGAGACSPGADTSAVSRMSHRQPPDHPHAARVR